MSEPEEAPEQEAPEFVAGYVEELGDAEIRMVAESFLIPGAHPNLKLVAEAALESVALRTQLQQAETALRRIGVLLAPGVDTQAPAVIEAHRIAALAAPPPNPKEGT